MVLQRRAYSPKKREDTNMKKTNERIRVTTVGWDGTGYNGEAKERPIYTDAALPGKKFVKARFGKIWSYLIVTNERHPESGEIEVSYFCDCTDR
jgi:hypothetical protein